MENLERFVKDIVVFRGVSDETLKRASKSAILLNLSKNERLYSDKQELSYVYFVVEGRVTISKYGENGENKVIFIMNKNDMINQPIMRRNTSAVECWAFEKSKIIRISFEEFDKIMESDYVLARNCMLYMENRIRRLYRQLKNSVSINIEKKLAAKLFRLGSIYGTGINTKIIKKRLHKEKTFQKDGGITPGEDFEIYGDLIDEFSKLDINISVTKLSKMLGSPRETVSRAMKKLSNEGLVKIEGREIYVNLKGLQEFFKS